MQDAANFLWLEILNQIDTQNALHLAPPDEFAKHFLSKLTFFTALKSRKTSFKLSLSLKLFVQTGSYKTFL